MAKLLVTIPGIGYFSALLVLSEIGDINRFPDSYHLCSYAGLVPSTLSSGGITYHDAITKTGSKHLRWIMIECVHIHKRISKNTNITQFYTAWLNGRVKIRKQLLLQHRSCLKLFTGL